MITAKGVEIPGVPKAAQEQKAEADQATPAIPDPGQLEASWWHYFEAEGEELQKRIQMMMEQLNTLENSLPPELVEQTKPDLERLRANLLALPQATAQAEPPPPVSPTAYQESYSLEQFLTKARNLRQAQAQLQQDRRDVIHATQIIKIAEKNLDNSLAAYLALSAEDTERGRRGLEIMATRSALEIDKQRLRVRKANLQVHENYTDQLNDELKIVKQHLTVNKQSLEKLEQAIAEAEITWEQAQHRLSKAQTKVMGVIDDTPQAKAQFNYLKQQVVQAVIELALSKVALARLRTQNNLSLLLSAPEKSDIDALRAHTNEMNELIKELTGSIPNWTDTSNREQSQASEALATAPNDTDDLYAKQLLEIFSKQRLQLSQDTLLKLEQLKNAVADLQLINEQLGKHLLEHAGYLRTWSAWVQKVVTDYWQISLSWFNLSLFKISDTPVTFMGLLRVILILFIAWSISKLLQRALNRLGQSRHSLNQAALYTIARLAHYVIIIIGLVIGLSSIGIDFTNFALIAGALSVGIGFGLQTTVSNFVSGLIILFERNLKVGDFIELDAELAGEVKEINVRSTLINTNDNVDIVVPNSDLVSNRVINWTLREAYIRVRIPFRVAYGADIDKVDAAVLEATDNVRYTLKGRAPQVWMTHFGESSLNFILGVWIMSDAVKQPTAVHAAYIREIEKTLRKYEIEIPFPQRDLHLRSTLTTPSLMKFADPR